MRTDIQFRILIQTVLACGQAYWRACKAVRSEIVLEACRVELILTRDNLQIERASLEPFGEIPRHEHPDVDSYELPLWGSGEMFIGHHHFKLNGTDWKPLYIARTKAHGGRALEYGGGFLSVQRWHVPITGSIRTNWKVS